jgi:hypothetical protein
MNESIWTHIGIAAGIVIPLGSGLGYVIWQQAQLTLKVDVMFEWFTNGGHEITGGDKYADLKRKR